MREENYYLDDLKRSGTVETTKVEAKKGDVIIFLLL